MQHAIQNGVGERWIVQIGMPMFRRQWAGNQGRACADPIIEYFQQVIALDLIDGGESPVVANEQIGLRQQSKPFAEAAVAMCYAQVLEQTWRAHVNDR